MILISALILGFLSSWHCLGMCGPLVAAVHTAGGNKAGTLIYNSGRILTYLILGALMGTLGMAAFLVDIQQYLSILLGISVLVLLFRQSWLNALTAKYHGSKLIYFIRKEVLNKNSFRTSKGKFLAGMANGLLPCGLVYVALAGAIAQPSTVDGMAYMAVFGLGTLPAMMATQMLPINWLRRPAMRKLAYAGMLVISCLFFYRAIHFQQTGHVHTETASPFEGIPLCGG